MATPMILSGGTGNDFIKGGTHNDTIYGDGGNDTGLAATRGMTLSMAEAVMTRLMENSATIPYPVRPVTIVWV